MKRLFLSALTALILCTPVYLSAADETPSDTAVVTKGETQITISGELRFRGMYEHNVTDTINDGTANTTRLNIVGYSTPAVYNVTNNGGTNYIGRATNGSYVLGSRVISSGDDHASWYDTRVRIGLEAKVSDAITAMVELESNMGNNITDVYTWGSASGATGSYQAGNAKRGDMRLRQAWIQYTGKSFGVKVGHQPLVLGNGIFLDHSTDGDDVIFLSAKPMKNFTIAALTAKLKEGNVNSPDDTDLYSLLGIYTSENFNISGDVSFLNDQSFNDTTSKTHLFNFGLRADYTLSALTLRGDVEVQAGTIDWNVGNSGRFKGWALLTGVDYKVGPAKLTLEYGYGSGQAKDDPNRSDIKSFANSQNTEEPGYAYVYDYHVANACTGLNGVTSGSNLCNTMYIKGGVSVELTKSLTGELYGLWLRAPQDTYMYDGQPSKNIGWEIDAKVAYKIAKNLTYWIEGGYLFTGSIYDRVKTETFTYTNPSITPVATYEYTRDNAYALRHGILLTF
ncbi:MAG: alginate export family protein [Nitrospirae bacterium]|nr:alginate export family protein [Nitrospirota bacterium]MBF0534431.1 alginate export family protein [Nitrospirota bacterium]MBF0618377.1 alginate export family protein [Nitrospirota bacterium]